MRFIPSTTGTTRADNDTSKPSVTAPGDGPADTCDPTERVSSAAFDSSTPEALAAGTVNAVVRMPAPKPRPPHPNPRMEYYTTTGPDGRPVDIERNIETGETRIIPTLPDSA